MRKIILTCLAMAATFAVSAQIETGTVLVGASSAFGVNSQSPKTGSSTTLINLNLKGGYFVMDNLAVGLNVDYFHASSNGSTSSLSTIGVFGRYYYQGKIFGGLGISAVSPSSGSGSTSIPLEVGYAAFITKNIAVEPSLNYTINDNYDLFGVNVGLTLYLNRK